MCLAIPSKIISLNTEQNTAVVDTMGVQREARLELCNEELSIGDWVLLHIGYIVSKIDESAARSSLELYEQIVRDIEQEDLARENFIQKENLSQKEHFAKELGRK